MGIASCCIVEWSIAADSAGGAADSFFAEAFLAGALFPAAFFEPVVAFFGAAFLAWAAFFAGGIGIVMPPCSVCCAATGADNDASASALIQVATFKIFTGFFPATE
jgi:hypothetical protein